MDIQIEINLSDVIGHVDVDSLTRRVLPSAIREIETDEWLGCGILAHPTIKKIKVIRVEHDNCHHI